MDKEAACHSRESGNPEGPHDLLDSRFRGNDSSAVTYLIPTWDKWRAEYVHAADNLLGHLTGFTGSLGILIIHKAENSTTLSSPRKRGSRGSTNGTMDPRLREDDGMEKHLFVDSRYTLQAQQECPDITLHPYDEWRDFLKNHATSVSVDPWLWSEKELEGLPNIQFLSLIDHFWPDRPARPTYKINDYTRYTDDKESKIQRVCAYLKDKNADALLITDSESLSWLVNIRSYDKPYCPSVEQYGVVYADGDIQLCHPRESGDPENITALLGPRLRGNDTLVLDTKAPLAIRQQFPNAIVDTNPITLMKACKSPVELEGFKNAHRQDGIAMREFLSWLEKESLNITEIDAENQLLAFRTKQPDFIGPSFQTISACGPNGAIVHYRSTEKTNRKLEVGDIYLLDSGGQYYGGTTDITRTILYKGGAVPYEVKENFTLVLKGLIALSTTIFPKGTTGGHLDALARQFLWKKQRNYGHGTGHGVGACLGVHEGPQNISPRGTSIALQPGMVVSIEPGFYQPGSYGIRIENLVYVEKCDDDWYKFQTLTDAPIDTRLIDMAMITADEKAWLNKYS